MSDKKYLVIVNPYGGKKKGLKIFYRYVCPVFVNANIEYKLIKTERRNHAHEISYNLDLENWKALILISGDGLIHEVINGLMARPDWERAIKIPIGVIPGGTGNALHTSLCHQFGTYSKETFVEQCTKLVLRGETRNLDLLKITTVDEGKVYYCVIGFSWGLISDIDVESETLRFVGNLRYILYGLWRIHNLRYYTGSLSFVPCGFSEPPRTLVADAPPTVSGANSASHPARTLVSRFLRPETFKSTYALVARSSAFICGSCLPKPPERATFDAAPNNRSASASLKSPGDSSTAPNELVTVYLSNVSHVSQDFALAPGARIDDGTAHLSLLRKGVSKSQMLKFLFNAIDVNQIDPKFTCFTPVNHFTLHPKPQILPDQKKLPVSNVPWSRLCCTLKSADRSSIMTIDGERFPCTSVTVEVMPGMARILASPG